ncbi:hypothetical protein GCM10027034_00460 [Ramlibacter solisilvae]
MAPPVESPAPITSATLSGAFAAVFTLSISSSVCRTRTARLSDSSDTNCTVALASTHQLSAHHGCIYEQGTIMHERKTNSILRRFSLILEVTATYLGLPTAQAARLPLAKPVPLPLKRVSPHPH